MFDANFHQRKSLSRWIVASCGCGVLWLATTSPSPAAEAVSAAPSSVASFDECVARDMGDALPDSWPQADDLSFLRRATLDVLGRRPTLEEQVAFLADARPERRVALVDRLLQDPEFGRNWANYWCDLIAYRVVPPAEVVIDYGPFKQWFAGEWNAGRPWTEIAGAIVTASGRIEERPAVTFMAYHEAQPTKLAAETARLFLGKQIGCAECHDHPFDVWTRDQFHQFAAAFHGLEILRRKGGAADGVNPRPGGEYRAPDVGRPGELGPPLQPAALTGESLVAEDPRTAVAAWLSQPANPWFARAFVNHVWTRTMTRGLGDSVEAVSDDSRLPATHAFLAERFIASGYDIRDCFRTLLASRYYARSSTADTAPLALRGDEVFAVLSGALESDLALPPSELAPPPAMPASNDGLPPPKAPIPQSAADRVHDRFGYDPALRPDQQQPTILQALYLMNHPRLQQEFAAAPGSPTLLARLLAEEADDRRVVETLYRRALGREPTAAEVLVFAEHRDELGDRQEAFEDLLWALVNSAEFLTRR